MRQVIFPATSFVLSAFVACAADVSGKWVASFTAPNGQIRESTITLKMDGDKLTGTISSPRGDSSISDGRVNGDDFSFVVVRTFRGNEVKFLYKGKVTGNNMKINIDAGDRSFELTAKRSTS